MWKLLLVDDEPLVVTGLKTMLPWDELGIELCGPAYNGKDALACIEQKHPDIIIADIKMPVISGIELMRICKERYGDVPVFILLTSYEDFSYAKEAVHFEAVEYLLKMELNTEKLKNAVAAAVERLQRLMPDRAPSINLQSFYDKFFIRLIYHIFDSPQQYESQRQLLNLNFDYPAFICCYCRIEPPKNIPPAKILTLCQSTVSMARELVLRYCPSYTISLDMTHFAIIFCLNEEQHLNYTSFITNILNHIRSTLHGYFNIPLSCAVGQVYTMAEKIDRSFLEAHRLITLAEPGKPAVFYEEPLHAHSGSEPEELKNIKEQFSKALEEYNETKLIEAFEQLFEYLDYFRSTDLPYSLIIYTASNLLFIALTLLPDGEKTVPGIFSSARDGYRSLYHMATLEQMMNWLIDFRDGLCQIINNKKRDYKKNTVFEVQKYIQNNLNKKLSLNEVADTFGLSPNYLSSIFRKNCDYSFTEYINHTKIKEAKKMLTASELKIYEISEQLGFEDAFYFSKVFKKIEGCSPKEYLHRISK